MKNLIRVILAFVDSSYKRNFWPLNFLDCEFKKKGVIYYVTETKHFTELDFINSCIIRTTNSTNTGVVPSPEKTYLTVASNGEKDLQIHSRNMLSNSFHIDIRLMGHPVYGDNH